MRYVTNEIFKMHCIVNDLINTRTPFVTTLSVAPNSLKCNISMNNCPIALQFGTEVQSQHKNTYVC